MSTDDCSMVCGHIKAAGSTIHNCILHCEMVQCHIYIDNIRNVVRCRNGSPKSMQKGRDDIKVKVNIYEAPSLILFHIGVPVV